MLNSWDVMEKNNSLDILALILAYDQIRSQEEYEFEINKLEARFP